MEVKTENVTVRVQPDIKTKDTMSDAEFNIMMQIGLNQAKRDESGSVTDAFRSLRTEI